MNTCTTLANDLMPGGVSSPVRSGKGLFNNPPRFTHAKGHHIFINDQSYLDHVNGFGMHILGHQNDIQQSALEQHNRQFVPGGVCHENELRLAQIIIDRVKSAEKIRFCVSGTEACMTALRIARHHTQKPGYVTIQGGYHGHGDLLLNKKSPHHFIVPYNDSTALEAVFAQHHKTIGAFMLEPICGNMGMIKPQVNYLKNCQKLCNQYGILLICDEVMTGFRTQYSTVSDVASITPDLMCFAKVIGGGLPLACITGQDTLMNHLAPHGAVTHAGTYASLHPCVLTGLATLSYLKPKHYHTLDLQTKEITSQLSQRATHYKIPFQVNQQGGMWGFFFSDNPVFKFSDIPEKHTILHAHFYKTLFKHGVYLPPNAMEACFINLSHQARHTQELILAAEVAFKEIAAQL